MLPLVIFMRHGQAESNVNRILAGRHMESHLTEQGRQQVVDSAKQLVKTIAIEKVYASPVVRTVETAQIVCQILGYGLMWLMSDYTRPRWACFVDELRGYNNNLRWRSYEVLFRLRPYSWSFESNHLPSVKHRITNLLDDLLQKHEDSNVLMVTHLDPITQRLPLCLT